MADQKDKDDAMKAYLILAGLAALAGAAFYENAVTPYLADKLTGLGVTGPTVDVLGPLAPVDLAAIGAVLLTAIAVALLVRTARRLLKRPKAKQ